MAPNLEELRPRANPHRMTAPPRKTPATYKDVLDAPEHSIAQVVDGELHLQPRPARRHTRFASTLLARLGRMFGEGDDDNDDARGGWLFLFEPELHLGPEPQILVPDIAGWRGERAPTNDGPAYYDTAPDWVCEVLSERTAYIDRGRKADIYAREGVKHLWFVDVKSRFVECFELVNDRWSRVGVFDGEEAAVPPFEAEAIDLERIFGEP